MSPQPSIASPSPAVAEQGRWPTTPVPHLLAILSAVMIVGCSRVPTLAARIQSAGGEVELKRECRAIFDEHQKTLRDFDASAAPPTIAALEPQVVQVMRYDGLPMVDIQMSGGFSHHGLMVVLTSTPPAFLPRKSSWRVTKIGDGLYEYRE